MRRFFVEWIVRTPAFAEVFAESEAEAIEKAKRGDVIEGSQDTDPGTMDCRTVKIHSLYPRNNTKA